MGISLPSRLGGLWERRKLPQRGPGLHSPGEKKRFYCFLSVSERLSLQRLWKINVVHSLKMLHPVASNLLIYLRINNIDHSVCQIIGPAAARSAGPIPTPVRPGRGQFFHRGRPPAHPPPAPALCITADHTTNRKSNLHNNLASFCSP